MTWGDFMAWRDRTPQVLVGSLASPTPGLAAGGLANTAVFTLGIQVLLKGLTWGGVLHSWLLGTLVFSAFGPGAYALVCLYFLLGTAVTKLRIEQKEAEGIAEKRRGKRGPGSVWGSGFAGILCAAAALVLGDPASLLRIGFVASFGSKLSDTVSSEVGKASSASEAPHQRPYQSSTAPARRRTAARPSW